MTYKMEGSAPMVERAGIIIPTYKAERYFSVLAAALLQQGIAPEQLLVIDSSSPDKTAALFREFGAQVVVIPQKEFNHGGTRQHGAELMSQYEFLIYMTQDAIPAHAGAFERILEPFSNPAVGQAYGRQLPRSQARAIERHARQINYPASAIELRSLEDRRRMGIKTVFCSNSFSAYRRGALDSVGGFPRDAFFAEDQITAGRMLLSNWKLAYVGDACAVHSHGYTTVEEFRRYFDVGVFHARNPWLLEAFGRAEGEGLRFVVSELRYLLKSEPLSVPIALVRTAAKYLGYRLGLLEHCWSRNLKAWLSMSPAYWR